jgi:hypothetical protein
MRWILNRGFGAERMPSQRGKVYCTEWCWHIGRLAREGTGAEANSAPKLGVSLGARAWPRIGNLSRLLDARRHILVLYLFPNITPPWRGAARWANLASSQISNIAISQRTRPHSQPAVSKARPRSTRPLFLVVWTGPSIPRQRRFTDA